MSDTVTAWVLMSPKSILISRPLHQAIAPVGLNKCLLPIFRDKRIHGNQVRGAVNCCIVKLLSCREIGDLLNADITVYFPKGLRIQKYLAHNKEN